MLTLLKRLIIILCCLISCESFATQFAWDFTSTHQSSEQRISYGNERLQFGELRLPQGRGPFPVVIIVHGGCWIANFTNIQNMTKLADALRDNGIATWNIEYRSVDNNGGGWPGTFQDVANATDFLRKIAPKYSLDLTHVVVVGYSAGGHLALWLAARHKLPESSQLYNPHPLALKGVVVLGGVPDLKVFRQQAEKVCVTDVIGNLLGNSPELIVKHYKEASPKELLPLGVPQILIYGSEDPAVPVEFARAYMKLALRQGDAVKLIIIKHAAHHEYVSPDSITWPAVKSAILSLL
jgi:acetyl esterase/lipase